MIEQAEKPKRTEKRKNQRSVWGGIALLILCVFVVSGVTLNLIMKEADTPSMSVTLDASAIILFADTCDATDGRYQIQKTHKITHQKVFTLDEQYVLTIDENGYFAGRSEHPFEQQLFPPGVFLQSSSSYDRRYFTFVGQAGLWLLSIETGNMKLISETATDFRAVKSWSPDSNYFVYSEGTALHLVYVQTGHSRALPLSRRSSEYYNYQWSPDSRHLVMYSSDNTTRNMNIFSVENLQDVALDGIDEKVEPGTPHWSPDGKYVAYSYQNENKQQTLILLNLETNARQEFSPPDDYVSASPYVWSPDSQYIAAFVRNEMHIDDTDFRGDLMIYNIYGESGMPFINGTVGDPFRINPFENPSRYTGWASDENMLYIWHESHDDTVSIFHLNVDTFFADEDREDTANYSQFIRTIPEGKTYYDEYNEVFIRDYSGFEDNTHVFFMLNQSGTRMYEYVVPEPDGVNIGYYMGARGKNLILENLGQGEKFIRILGIREYRDSALFEAAVESSGVVFSLDTKYIAVAWTDIAENDPDRHFYITWAAVDGNGQVTLKKDFHRVYDLLWTDNNEWLAYTYSHGNDVGVEIINRSTKEIISILTDAYAIDHKEHDAKTGIWTVWWTDFAGQSYASVFDVEGIKLFDIEVDVIIDSDPPRYTEIFTAPVTGAQVFKFTPEYNGREYFVLLDEGDNIIILTEHTSRLKNITWSLDGQYIRWLEYKNRSEAFLIIVDRTGERLYEQAYEAKEIRDISLIWATCD